MINVMQRHPPVIQRPVMLLKRPKGKAILRSLEQIATALGTTVTKELADNGLLVCLNKIKSFGHIAIEPDVKDDTCIREENEYSALNIRAFSYPDAQSVHAFNQTEAEITRAIEYICDRLEKKYWPSQFKHKSL